MEDYFDKDFNFENEDFSNFNMDDFIQYFLKKYGIEDKPREEYLEDNIDNLHEEGFEMEDLLDEDSQFVKIMEKLESVRFERMMNENYMNLKDNGLNIHELKHQKKEDIARVVETINIMQETFLDREEYEKCAVLRPIIQKIEEEIKL